MTDSTEKSKGGRPDKFRPEYTKVAAAMARLGATDQDLADHFEVARTTIISWRNRHPKFNEALTVAKDEADERVKQSLYRRAVGYVRDAVKVVTHKGEEPKLVEFKEEVPGDVTACIFWLKNRRPEEWKDVHRQELTGKDGKPLLPKVIVEFVDAK